GFWYVNGPQPKLAGPAASRPRPGEGHKGHRKNCATRYRPCFILGEDQQVLLAMWLASGNDQPAAGLDLFHQGWRDLARSRGYDDGVERGMFRPTLAAITAPQRDVGEALLRQHRGRTGGEFRNDLDRPDRVGKAGEHRRLISRAGADLEHP